MRFRMTITFEPDCPAPELLFSLGCYAGADIVTGDCAVSELCATLQAEGPYDIAVLASRLIASGRCNGVIVERIDAWRDGLDEAKRQR